MKEKEIINDLVYFDNTKIVQNDDYFKVSLDSIILPNFVNIKSNKKNILDLCTGNAPIPIILSKHTKSKIYGIELQKDIYDLAVKSVDLNNLNEQITLINDDIKNVYNYFNSDYFDIITCNPPYFKINECSNINTNSVKANARHELNINLNDIIEISKVMLKNNGDIFMVNRTERLIEIIDLMKKNNIEPKIIRFVYPKVNKNSNLVLISGKKNGKSGLKMLPPLFVHNEDGSYTDEILKMFS